MERCGKINVSNSLSKSWTGIGVVAGGAVVVLILQGPHMKQGDAHWRITLLHILQEVRIIYKTRNHLTIKNLVIGGIHTRKVNYLSQTYEGKRHDKKIADEENPTYPVDIGVYKDTGFQGYEPEGVKTLQPQKQPKGKELTPA